MKRSVTAIAVFLALASISGAAVDGPLKVSPDGRHFVDGRGAPFFWLGDTAWPLFTQYSREQAEAYLENRAPRASPSSRASSPGATEAAWSRSPRPPIRRRQALARRRPGRPTTPTSSTWTTWSTSPRQGLVLAMLPTWGYYVKETPLLNAGNARAYGRWLGARYRTLRTSSGSTAATASRRASRPSTGNWRRVSEKATAART